MEQDRKLIPKMRERTGLPLLTCRRFLIEADWDLEKAITLAKEETRKSMRRFGGIMDG